MLPLSSHASPSMNGNTWMTCPYLEIRGLAACNNAWVYVNPPENVTTAGSSCFRPYIFIERLFFQASFDGPKRSPPGGRWCSWRITPRIGRPHVKHRFLDNGKTPETFAVLAIPHVGSSQTLMLLNDRDRHGIPGASFWAIQIVEVFFLSTENSTKGTRLGVQLIV